MGFLCLCGFIICICSDFCSWVFWLLFLVKWGLEHFLRVVVLKILGYICFCHFKCECFDGGNVGRK